MATSKSTTFTHCSGVLKRNELTPFYAWFDSGTTAAISYKILVKIGRVVSAENRLTDGNCVACSRGSAYFVKCLQIYTGPIFTIFSPYERTLRADDGSAPYFSNLPRDVAMAAK